MGETETTQESITAYCTELRRFLVERFNKSELRDLCFDLGILYETLPGSGLGDKARELVAYCARRDRLEKLVQAVHDARPNSFHTPDFEQKTYGLYITPTPYYGITAMNWTSPKPATKPPRTRYTEAAKTRYAKPAKKRSRKV